MNANRNAHPQMLGPFHNLAVNANQIRFFQSLIPEIIEPVITLVVYCAIEQLEIFESQLTTTCTIRDNYSAYF